MIHVYSEVGIGTTFKIYLPVVEGQAKVLGETIEEPAPGGTETILLAEDNESVRKLSLRILKEAGYTVLLARDGEEALRVFEEHHGEIALALLDVVMPKLGGGAVQEQISRREPAVKFLFTSGYSSDAIHKDFILNVDILCSGSRSARAISCARFARAWMRNDDRPIGVCFATGIAVAPSGGPWRPVSTVSQRGAEAPARRKKGSQLKREAAEDGHASQVSSMRLHGVRTQSVVGG